MDTKGKGVGWEVEEAGPGELAQLGGGMKAKSARRDANMRTK